ncbi:MAG: cell division protein FtsA [Nitrospinae bacterium]|nr:cell division protein FtsA [Nitrospinota bacterium]
MAKKEKQVITGLDLGTTKICCVIAEVGEGGGLDIIGIGTHPSKGLNKGVVVNIESTVESIKSAVEEAELMAGVEIESAYVGIAGGHIKGFNSHGIIAVKNKEVTEMDKERVIEAAKAVAIPLDREVIHVIPQQFILDGQSGIKEPRGMSGVRLEARIHVITGAVTSAQNIVRSVNRAGLDVDDIIVEQLASAESVLDTDERDLGVALVDIGGGTADLALFAEDSVRYTSVIAIGGNHITNDLAIGLRTPQAEAEKIKRKYGCALSTLVKRDEQVEIPSMGGREPRIISRNVLSEIIEPRVDEIFQMIHRDLETSGYLGVIPSGLVITGGTAMLEGITDVAERVFGLPVRRGNPKGVGGLVDVVNSPQYATAVGLLLFGHRLQKLSGEPKPIKGRNMFNNITDKMKGWIEDFF